MEYKFIVSVEAENYDQACKVMQERIDYTEDYGFSYMLDWS
jgi:hypothetical protein